ncbi:hypothetical protein CCICO_02735 [Corynebacterium ciconiae DSM 44920]|uniref:hypothetical protein n=1 Tax=Corynebacterium ciconiae TaxID=227319 RepID=UPI00036E292B|nr:hypothetical protein [Corynebacterium ciconiae]WKD60594.1 hypothetical protein CCICO_02735 [Corynebacterium ciconiae DSM 44920]
MSALLLIAVVIGLAVFILSRNTHSHNQRLNQTTMDDAVADARRWIERLGSQVLSLTGSDAASTQALADASERYNAASSQISTAATPKQAQMARESALEGLHYVNAAREIMGMPAGPELPPLEGQRAAGKVTEPRTITHDGNTISASPQASANTPHYYPGGTVAGRPVPAGWYSTAWWGPALATGVWTAGSVLMFSALFSGMSGVHYGAEQFEDGTADGSDDLGGMDDSGDMGDTGDMGDSGDMGDTGGDGGGFFDGGDGGLFDGGGFDFDF